MTFEAVYPGVAFILLADAVLFIGPLYIFSRKLWLCKAKGLSDLSAFAGRFMDEFDGIWLGTGPAPGEHLLGTSDIQPLADLSNSVGIVRNMRFVPASASILTDLAVAALVPLPPLMLFKYPIRAAREICREDVRHVTMADLHFAR